MALAKLGHRGREPDAALLAAHVADERRPHSGGEPIRACRVGPLEVEGPAGPPASVPPMSETVIEVRDLVKRFGERPALRGISFEAHRGELLAVIGPNGAGKTTLLTILAGIRGQDEGSVSRSPGELILNFAGARTTVIFSTHYIQQAERYSARPLVLAGGEGLFDGTVAELHSAVPESRACDFEEAFVFFLRERGH